MVDLKNKCRLATETKDAEAVGGDLSDRFFDEN